MISIPELLEEHVSLTVESIDRVYLNGYVPTMQTSGALVHFMEEHRGELIASPVLLGQITRGFASAVETYAETEGIPLAKFKKGERKDDVAKKYHRQFDKEEGVVFIGVAQEKANGFKGKKEQEGKAVRFRFSRQSVYVKVYYFYLRDKDFGPGFIKIVTYAPYAVKVCLNGHEWAKQQLRQEGIGFEGLDNGFLSCDEPERLQAICAQLGPEQVQAFFDKWVERLPWPLTAADRKAGYQHRLSIWQMELSLTHVFDRPVRGCEFFEQLIRDNMDLGRPDRVQLIFGRQVRRDTPSRFQTRVIQAGVQPSLHITYKHSGVKQYFKENRALRTETTINNPQDFAVGKDLSNWMYLRQLAAAINQRLLANQRLSQDCLLSAPGFFRVTEPTLAPSGQRAPGLRFGQPRVMALFAALCRFSAALNGFRHRDLKPVVQDLLHILPDQYSASQMTYDLRRLRFKGLIKRIDGTHRYIITTYGRRVASLMTKLHNRIFNVASIAFSDHNAWPNPLAQAFKQIDDELEKLIADAHLAPS